jgi:hypothetical protein
MVSFTKTNKKILDFRKWKIKDFCKTLKVKIDSTLILIEIKTIVESK